ncbi:hypothetical protein MNBD_NITROSPINAE04-2536 [hydrothermal vent metagenome]|uniref:Outer membrane efflux protein n=1 Tax=hydrothermal vent metagenome TaxID=652676 RepID=A0A3B1BXR3_9ZZZZ
MSGIKKALWSLAFLCAFPSPAAAEALTLERFLNEIRENHPFFVKEALSSDIEKKKQEKFLGDEDWLVRSSPFFSHQQSAYQNAFTLKSVDQAGLNASLGRTFWKTGGRLSFSYDYTGTNRSVDDIVIPLPGATINIPSGSGMFYENGFAMTYSHPLMKNKDGFLSKLDYDLQAYNISATDIVIKENQENFLLSAAILFIDWALLKEQRRILEKRLELAKEELERTKRKRKQNMVDEVDVIRARDAVLNARQNVLSAEAGMRAKGAEIGTIAQLKDVEGLEASHDLYSLETAPSVDEAVDLLKANSRVLKVFDVRLGQINLSAKGAEEREKPQLGLNLSGGLTSGAWQYGDSLGYNKPQYSASLNFSYPLGNRTARADLAKTRVEKDRIEEGKENMSLKLESGLRNLLTHIKELEKVLAVNIEQIEVAKEKTGEELKRYNQGRIELTFVIDSRDREQNIQLIYAQNAALYNKLVLRYKALTDSLL